VVAYSHGRRDVWLVDVPCFERPVRLRCRKPSWRCVEPVCRVKVFTQQDHQVAPPRVLLTTRACWWAIGRSATSTPRSPGSPVNWARPGTRAGPRSGPCLRRWPTATPGSQARPGPARRRRACLAPRVRTPDRSGGCASKYLTGMVDLTPGPDGDPAGEAAGPGCGQVRQDLPRLARRPRTGIP